MSAAAPAGPAVHGVLPTAATATRASPGTILVAQCCRFCFASPTPSCTIPSYTIPPHPNTPTLTSQPPAGDIDPAIIPYLQSHGMSIKEVDTLMNKKSGFLGLAGGWPRL